MIKDLISIIFPENCLGCRQSLINEEQFLCLKCKLDLPVTSDHTNVENELFRKFAFLPSVKTAQSFTYFIKGGLTQRLLYELKYGGKKELGTHLGRWYGEHLNFATIDRIVPVPLHKNKLRKRGYNQSEYFAKGLAEQLGIPVDLTSVRRKYITPSQTRKSRAERWGNMQNVYTAADNCLKGKSLLVVDDVITTGATIGMLCERLAEVGVREIHIASIARGN